MGAWAHGSVGARGRGSKNGPAAGRFCARAPARPGAHGATLKRAFTLVEVVLTVLIVGVGLAACLRALPVLLDASATSEKSLTAQRLATDLLNEIALLPFEDPKTPVTFGPEDDEARDTRADFDDVDDYDEWSASPPQTKDGTKLADVAAYTRSVLVQSVEPDDLDQTCSDHRSKPKLITVTVSSPDAPDLTISTVRLKGANREDR
ncbi:MAG: type IV pilus modification PilV family protein [Planctomycetota bacterium]